MKKQKPPTAKTVALFKKWFVKMLEDMTHEPNTVDQTIALFESNGLQIQLRVTRDEDDFVAGKIGNSL